VSGFFTSARIAEAIALGELFYTMDDGTFNRMNGAVVMF
jgi:hypothetical protein